MSIIGQVTLLLGTLALLVTGILIGNAYLPTKRMCWGLFVLTCIACPIAFKVVSGADTLIDGPLLFQSAQALLTVSWALLGVCLVNVGVLFYAIAIRKPQYWSGDDSTALDRRIREALSGTRQRPALA